MWTVRSRLGQHNVAQNRNLGMDVHRSIDGRNDRHLEISRRFMISRWRQNRYGPTPSG